MPSKKKSTTEVTRKKPIPPTTRTTAKVVKKQYTLDELYEMVKESIQNPHFFRKTQVYRNIQKMVTMDVEKKKGLQNIYKEIALPFLIRVATLHPHLEEFETTYYPIVYDIIQRVQRQEQAQKKIGMTLLQERERSPAQRQCPQQLFRTKTCMNPRCSYKHQKDMIGPSLLQHIQHSQQYPTHHLRPLSSSRLPLPPPPGFEPLKLPPPLVNLTQTQRKIWYP